MKAVLAQVVSCCVFVKLPKIKQHMYGNIPYMLDWFFPLKIGQSPASFSFIFGLFQTNINTILQQINVKNVHLVYVTGIQTYNLQNVSLLP